MANHPHSLVAIVTCLSLLVYVWMILRVGGARRRSGIAAPAMTGDADLERHLRVQLNTLEWLPIYLTSLWLFTLVYKGFPFNEMIAVGAGLLWVVGRVLYALGYVKDPSKREMGFLIQALATAVLLFGALGKAIYVLATVGL
ncbi:MAPEG family protein [Caulobacter sp. SLTY]|uniref:MAPEG family protein n=1 Tax=Caulobacter sp. SLTY TaxID=2683262 RepID=UPI001413700E|nr:MAPEG family protein [Caulobacter sp. SLTY]NBB13921.1 MAPEG family protein [Caulobacter sp. SLTY]